MTKAHENEYPYVLFEEQSSTPATPASGLAYIYRKTDNAWYFLDDAGTETAISTGSASAYVLQSLADAKGDLIIASADNTFAKHTAPADGSVLLADSSQSDGWSSLLHKFDGTTAPTADEDTGDGYAVGSLWMDVTNDKAYVCLDATSTAAVWTEITASPVDASDTGIAVLLVEPTADDQVPLVVPYDCTITSVTVLGDAAGSVVVDIWNDSYANYPPTDADTITASAPPTLSSAANSQDSTLTGWTTSLAKGDILLFNVDSASGLEWALVHLQVTRT